MNAAVRAESVFSMQSGSPTSYVNPAKNRLLALLPEDIQQRLFPHLEQCSLAQGTVLAGPGIINDHFWFPVDCLISQHCMLDNGAGSAMSVIGNDGVIGNDFFMESGCSATVSVVQVAGKAFRIAGDKVKQELNRQGRLQTLLFWYFHALLAQMAQTAVCNRQHTLDQQLCRWLLLSLDRLPGISLQMSFEQVAVALGATRDDVAEAAYRLQSQGITSCFRGLITVLDRRKLQHQACDCHQVLEQETNHCWFTGAVRTDAAARNQGRQRAQG